MPGPGNLDYELMQCLKYTTTSVQVSSGLCLQTGWKKIIRLKGDYTVFSAPTGVKKMFLSSAGMPPGKGEFLSLR